MVKLTEEMIVARTRVSDMSNVKKLNCWGAELSDISVLRQLVNVEVLSLSVNCITTLADIHKCSNLQELYIRKNKIGDLSEICWLRDLPKLKSLWLEENPCVQDQGELYRLTVIRNLPQLQKLDNITIQADEMADAMRRGQELLHPFDQVDSYHTPIPYQPPLQQSSSRSSAPRAASLDQDLDQEDHECRPSPARDMIMMRRSTSEQQTYYHSSPSRRVSNQAFTDNSAQSTQQQQFANGSRRNSSYAGMDEAAASYQSGVPEYHTGRRYSQQEMGPVRRSPRPSQSSVDEGVRRMSVHDEDRSYNTMEPARYRSPGYAAPGPPGPAHDYGPYAPPSGAYYEPSRPPMMDDEPSDTNGKALESEPLVPDDAVATNPNPNNSAPADDDDDKSEEVPESARAMVAQVYEHTYDQVNQQIESAQQLMAKRRSFSPERPRRPKNRNSNILSAVLCLIKELDGPSLEVVEMAVKCRIEELDD